MTNTEAAQHKHTSRVIGAPAYKYGSAAEIRRKFKEWQERNGIKSARGFGKAAR